MDDHVTNLLCLENKTSLEDEDSFFHLKDSSDSEDEYVGVLIEKEIDFGLKKDESLVVGNWLKRARFDAINWILKTRATFGFRFKTSYLSVTYLDRFLSRRSIESDKTWAVQLLSVACLSLAAKMEERKVPALSEFKMEDYSFESKVIKRMELLVLTTLEWKMGLITPFAFLPYLINKFCNESPAKDIVSKIMQLIITMMKEFSVVDHRPSAIAAAATLVALNQQLTRKALELKMSLVSERFLKTEDIFVCYSLMQKLDMENTRRGEIVHSPDVSPLPSSQMILLETSLATSSNITKRRRLTFSEDNEKSQHT